MKFVWGFLALIVGAIAVATIRPDMLPFVSDYVLVTPVAQVMSLRFWLVVFFVLAAIFFLIISLVRYKMVGAGRIASVLGVVLLGVGVIHGGIMFDRGINNPGNLGPDRGYSASGEGSGAITVLAYNTLGGETEMADVADIVASNGVDVVSLPETSSARGEELVALLGERGLTFQQFDTGTDQFDAEFESTVLLVSNALGEYRTSDTAPAEVSAVSVVPANGVGPEFVAVHPIAPVPELMDDWRTQIDSVYALCADTSNAIIAGDFNSTVDHQLALGYDCADGAAEAGAGAMGTWPASLPPITGSPIDRVLHTGGNYEGQDAALVSVGDSDHRGLLVRLQLAS